MTARKKPVPASVFSNAYSKAGSSPTSSAASSSSTNTTPVVTPSTRIATLQHVNSRSSLDGGAGRNTSSLRSPNTTTSINGGALNATAPAWHPTEASRALWQTNPQMFAGPVFPASPVGRSAPGSVGITAHSVDDLTSHQSSRSARATPTMGAQRSSQDLSSVSPAAFPADFSAGRFRSSRSSLDVWAGGGGGGGDSDSRNLLRPDDDDVVMEFVPLSDKMARSEAEIIANMVGAHRVGGRNLSIASSSHSSGADTADYNEMVDEMDRFHEQIGTPATLQPRSGRGPGPKRSIPNTGSTSTITAPAADGSTPLLSFALGPANQGEGAAAGDANPAGLEFPAQILDEYGEEDDEGDFNDYDTEFDDELDEAELEWIEQQLIEHSASHNDPGLFLF